MQEANNTQSEETNNDTDMKDSKDKNESKDLANSLNTKDTQESTDDLNSLKDKKETNSSNESKASTAPKKETCSKLEEYNELNFKMIAEKNKRNIDVSEVAELKDYKIYYDNGELYIVKVGKHLKTNIIFLCMESKEDSDPDFYYQSIYSQEDMIKLNHIFTLYKSKDRLYKLLIKIFNNNNVKVAKDLSDQSYIKLDIKLRIPDGERPTITLFLFRRDKEKNEEFYSSFISSAKQLENEQEKKDDESEDQSKKGAKKEKDEDHDALLSKFNQKYHSSLKLKDKELKLHGKKLFSDSVKQLGKIHFKRA